MKTKKKNRSDERLAACAVFGIAAPILYAVQRGYEIARDGEVRLVASAQVAFYYRAATATALALVIALVAYALVGNHARRVLARTPPVAIAVAVVFALAMWRLP